MYPLSSGLLQGSSTEVSGTYQSPCPEPVALVPWLPNSGWNAWGLMIIQQLGKGGGRVDVRDRSPLLLYC